MSAYYRKRLMLLTATLAACALFAAVGRWAQIPPEPGYEASLSVMDGAAGRMGVVVLAMIAATAVGTFLAGAVRVEAGLFATSVGLCVLSVRCGSMRYLLAGDELGPRLFGALAVELLLLGLTACALWSTLVTIARRRVPLAVVPPDAAAAGGLGSQRALAFTVQLIVTGGAALLLLASDDKKQAVFGLAVASFLGGVAASLSGPVPMGAWLCAGPVVVGVAGYAAAWMHGGLVAGEANWFAPLLRASPLDYAGAGVAGAILGRWVGVNPERTKDLAMTGAFGLSYLIYKRAKSRPLADA